MFPRVSEISVLGQDIELSFRQEREHYYHYLYVCVWRGLKALALMSF